MKAVHHIGKEKAMDARNALNMDPRDGWRG